MQHGLAPYGNFRTRPEEFVTSFLAGVCKVVSCDAVPGLWHTRL
jgi:hypothetical protein